MRILVTGDSHTGPLRMGQKLLESKDFKNKLSFDIDVRGLIGGNWYSRSFFIDRGDYAELIPECRKNFDRLPPSNIKYDWIGLSAPLLTIRAWRSVSWRHFCPWPLNDSGSVISGGLLRKIIEDDSMYSLALMNIIHKNTNVFVVEPPCLFRRHRSVLSNGEDKVSYIHKAYQNYIFNELDRLGVPVVRLDNEWVDENGFVDPVFSSEDPKDSSHGNAEFGRLMMLRIENFIRDNVR